MGSFKDTVITRGPLTKKSESSSYTTTHRISNMSAARQLQLAKRENFFSDPLFKDIWSSEDNDLQKGWNSSRTNPLWQFLARMKPLIIYKSVVPMTNSWSNWSCQDSTQKISASKPKIMS